MTKQLVRSVRFNPENERHARAWAILDTQRGKGVPYGDTIIDALLAVDEKFPAKYAITPQVDFEQFTRAALARMEAHIYALQEQLAHGVIQASPIVSSASDEFELENETLMFLSSFEDDSDE